MVTPSLQRQIRVTAGSGVGAAAATGAADNRRRGTLVIDRGAIAIDVSKTLAPDPPESTVTFTNISESTEEWFSDGTPISIDAGQSRLQNIYNGQVLRIEKSIQKPDTSLKLVLSNYVAPRGIPFNDCFDGLTAPVIVESLIRAMDLMPGNLLAIPNEVVERWCWQGSVHRGLTEFLIHYNLSWYINEGRVHLASLGIQDNTLNPLIINASNGMVGSPEKTDTGLKVRVLMDTPVTLNQLVEVESSTYTYGYDEATGYLRDTRSRRRLKVFGMRYSGDNWDGPFTNQLRLEDLRIGT